MVADQEGQAMTPGPNAQLVCTVCGYKAKRTLVPTTACRGHHETPSEPARCPRGHGELVRVDGGAARGGPTTHHLKEH
jgi:hypothetical protein